MESVKDLVAGTVGGVSGLFVGQPLDVLRIRAQTTWSGHQGSLMRKTTDMLRNEGLRSMYKGVVPPMLGVGAQNAVLFFAYGSAMRVLAPGGREENASLMAVTFAGSIGGFACGFVTGPVELLKCRQQVHEHRGGLGMVSLLRDMRAADGFAGIFRGLGATLARDVPSYGIYFWSYELIRRWYAQKTNCAIDALPGLVNFVAGGIGGSLSWLAIYPIDVVKSRLQVQAEGTARESILSCARRIYHQEGAKLESRRASLVMM